MVGMFHVEQRRMIMRFIFHDASFDEFVSDVYDAALDTLLWSETDDDGSPFDAQYYADDIAGEVCEFHAQVSDFVRANWDDLKNITAHQCGHDFIMTRNGHGCGFWDGDYPQEIGDRLTESCKPYGEANLYLGDDDVLYLSA
jgi:hypothetical protein